MLRAITEVSSRYAGLKQKAYAQIQALPEVQQRQKLASVLKQRLSHPTDTNTFAPATTLVVPPGLGKENASLLVQSSLATFLLHVESRIAALLGEGFYTIGPCGEEVLSVLGCVARPTDPMALHYRHLGTSIARRLCSGISLRDIVLDRARGYTCSMNDSITGGRHCALGGTRFDFYVTSTLASQAPAAVGRGLGIGLASFLHAQNPEKVVAAFPKDAVSICSVGDGSVNNGMYLSALNFAEYAQHRGFKCPVLFVVSNNDICISLRGYSWLQKFVKKQSMPVVSTDGRDVFDVWSDTTHALDLVRSTGKPAMLVIDNLPRRFGHAATDRQQAYLDEEEIATAAQTDTVADICEYCVRGGLTTWEEVNSIWDELKSTVEQSFAEAVEEPKVRSREEARENLQSSLIPYVAQEWSIPPASPSTGKPVTMRMCMTTFFHELLSNFKEGVYIGEDVRHGGYYLVTDGLHRAFPSRVHDIPPDETMLLGIGLGYSQSGLVPIVELPYAKYLDCGADQFFEIALLKWCTNGGENNGLLLRLQGFDKGRFGGNFHTHNSLHIPPGLDVVCYSNGYDYVRGLRYAMEQVRAGRVVMSVDSTDLLTRRDVFPEKKDGLWLRNYPDSDAPPLTFDHVTLYSDQANPCKAMDVSGDITDDVPSLEGMDCLVLTYGNGVPSALQCMMTSEKHKIAVIDCPNLGRLPKGLVQVLSGANRKIPIVLADVCKEGPNPLSYLVSKLNEAGVLNRRWKLVAAAPTYNPLGSLCTFLSAEDIISAVDYVAETSVDLNG